MFLQCVRITMQLCNVLRFTPMLLQCACIEIQQLNVYNPCVQHRNVLQQCFSMRPYYNATMQCFLRRACTTTQRCRVLQQCVQHLFTVEILLPEKPVTRKNPTRL